MIFRESLVGEKGQSVFCEYAPEQNARSTAVCVGYYGYARYSVLRTAAFIAVEQRWYHE